MLIIKKANVLGCDNLKDDGAVFQKPMDREFLQHDLPLSYPYALHDHIVQLVPEPSNYYLNSITLYKRSTSKDFLEFRMHRIAVSVLLLRNFRMDAKLLQVIGYYYN